MDENKRSVTHKTTYYPLIPLMETMPRLASTGASRYPHSHLVRAGLSEGEGEGGVRVRDGYRTLIRRTECCAGDGGTADPSDPTPPLRSARSARQRAASERKAATRRRTASGGASRAHMAGARLQSEASASASASAHLLVARGWRFRLNTPSPTAAAATATDAAAIGAAAVTKWLRGTSGCCQTASEPASAALVRVRVGVRAGVRVGVRVGG